MILALQEGGDEIDDGRTLQRQPPRKRHLEYAIGISC